MSDPTQPLLAERGITFFRRRYTSISEEEPRIARWRRSAREFLDSRWGHYLVLFLVTVDVCCSFSDFLIQLHVCELKQGRFGVDHGWEITQDVLSISSLVISCLFMVELIVSVLSFGMGYVGSVFDFVLDGLEFHGGPKGFHWTNLSIDTFRTISTSSILWLLLSLSRLRLVFVELVRSWAPWSSFYVSGACFRLLKN